MQTRGGEASEASYHVIHSNYVPVLRTWVCDGAKADKIAAPIGVPRPLQASHPGPAVYAPLLPEVMSWNALAVATAP